MLKVWNSRMIETTITQTRKITVIRPGARNTGAITSTKLPAPN